MANNWKRTERAMVLIVGSPRDLTKLHSWPAKTSLMITRLQHHTGSVISEWVRRSRSLFDFDTMVRHLLLLTFLLVPQVLGNSIRIQNCESELFCSHFICWYLKYNAHFEDNSRTKRFTGNWCYPQKRSTYLKITENVPKICKLTRRRKCSW